VRHDRARAGRTTAPEIKEERTNEKAVDEGMIYSRGDPVMMIHGDQTVDAEVLMVSENQSAALISFEAIVGGHVGKMPLLLHGAMLAIYRVMGRHRGHELEKVDNGVRHRDTANYEAEIPKARAKFKLYRKG
jgi:hypothetical protein